MTIHGTALAIGERGVLLRGHSGAGKSDLALRLMAVPRSILVAFDIADVGQITLVADDRVALEVRGDRVWAQRPPGLPSALEVRGLGLVSVTTTAEVAICLVVDIVKPEAVPRLPEPSTVDLNGIAVPRLLLDPFEASAPLKVVLAALRVRTL